MKSERLTLDPAYSRWRLEYEAFAVRCFGALSEFLRLHFDDLLDEYYCEGHESLNAFAGWAFERYLQEVEGTGSRECLD